MSDHPTSSNPPLPPPAELPSPEAKDSGVSSLSALDARSLSELVTRATPDELRDLFLSVDSQHRRRLERLCDEIIAAPPKEEARIATPREEAILDTPEANLGNPASIAEAEQLSATLAVVALPEPVVQGPPMPPAEVVVGVGPPELPQSWEVPNSLAVVRTPVQLAQAKQPSAMQKLRRFDPKQTLMDIVLGAPSSYCESLARRHWAWLLAYVCVIVAVLSAGWHGRPIKIDTDIQAFRRIDQSPEYAKHAAYRDALRRPKGVVNASSLEDRKTFQIELYYQAKSGSVFAEAPLRDIRTLEEKLRALSGWVKMCEMSDPASRFRCQPGESMANYAWPERSDLSSSKPTPFNLAFTGESRERLPVDAFLTYLDEGRAGSHDLRKFLPHNGGAQVSDQAGSTLLRTVFSFTAPSQDSADFEKEYEKFVAEELFLTLKKEVENAEEDPDDPYIDPWSIRLFYKSKEIEEHEVRFFLNKDITLTIGCLVFIFIFLVFQLRSVILAFAGLAQVCLVPLIAYVVVNHDKLSLTSFACIFLVMGLVSNDLPAAKEYWRRVGKESNHMLPVSAYGSFAYNHELIMYFSYRVSLLFPALFLRLLPQFMVGLTFLVFLQSNLKPIVEFGQVMCASMMVSCGMTLTIIPALLVLHEALILPLIHKLPAGLAMVLEPKDLPFPWRPLTKLLLKVSQPKIGRFIWLGAGIVMLALTIITIVVAANSDNPGVPEVFSSSHHSIAGEPLVDAFLPTAPADTAAPSGTRVCEMNDRNTDACGLHWCEAPLSTEEVGAEPEPQAASDCVCQVSQDVSKIGGCQYLSIGGKMSGHAFARASVHARSLVWKDYIRSVFPSLNHTFMDGWKPGGKSVSSLVLEHWASGKTDVEPVVEMPWKTVSLDHSTNPPQSASNTCSVDSTCYCGPRVCDKPSNWLNGQKITVPVVAAGRLLLSEPEESARFLQSVPTPSMREIIRAWGIGSKKQDDGSVKAVIGNGFDPSSPWQQRSMLSICTDIPESFNVIEKTCWIEDFKEFLTSAGEKFPTQRFGDFHGQFKRFRNERPDVKITAMWTNNDGNLIATAVSFMVPPKERSDVTGILDEMKAWKGYAGWVTSDGWVEAEAESEAMQSSWTLLILAYIAVILAGLIYTWDVAFTFITVGIATLGLFFVWFFVFCICGWAIGPWEVILTVAFLHHFTEPAFRVGRGAVWAGVMVKEMRIAGNVLTPHAERTNPKQRLEELEPPELPAAIEDVENPNPAREIETPAPASDIETPAPLLDTPTPITDVQPNSTSTDEETPETPAALNESGADIHEVGTMGSENTSEADEHLEAAARSAFEGRLHRFTLNISNTVWPLALKLMFCAFFLLFCTFRLFSRLGVFTLIVEIVILPCTFILLPAAILLCPTREEPDIILLYKFINRKLQERSDSVDSF